MVEMSLKLGLLERGLSLRLDKHTGSPDPNHHREEYLV